MKIRDTGTKSIAFNKDLTKKHNTALIENYKKHGVGKSIKDRFAFWESQHPDGYSISHNPTIKGKVMIFEAVWLGEQFPGDFNYF